MYNKTSIILVFTILAVIIAVPCHSQSVNDIIGLWHINKQSANITSMQNISSIGSATKWMIKVSSNKISIAEYTDTLGMMGKSEKSERKLDIKDFDYTNGRLQILTEDIYDAGFGVSYHTTYYDIRLDASKQRGQGSWKSETSSGANDMFKLFDGGSVAIRKLSDKPPPTKRGNGSLSIERN
jgi:hypothetical protein